MACLPYHAAGYGDATEHGTGRRSTMSTIILLATAWGSKHGGINVVNMELTRALAEVFGAAGRVLCVVPYAEKAEVDDAQKSGAMLVPLGLDRSKLPDFFDPGWLGTVQKKLAEAGVSTADWCIGHDAISGAAANAMKSDKAARASAVICHMSYADYQGVKHPEYQDIEFKIREQKHILKAADVVIAVGPLLSNRAFNIVDRPVPMLVPGLPSIKSRPLRTQFEAVSFGRFERANDRIKQIQLAAEGFAEARRRADEPGGPQMLRDNPMLKLIGVSKNDAESSFLRRVMHERAKQIVSLRPIPYQEDRQELFEEIAGSSAALMLSWHEGFGLTGWEAIAAEVPLIISRQSGLYELLYTKGLHGLVRELRVNGSYGDDETPNFTDEDRRRVADHILEVAREPEVARKMARNLKESLISQGCTWPNAAQSVLKALEITPPPPALLPAPEPSGSVDLTPEAGLTLAAYLASVREIAGRVILAGEHEPRPIQDVFVELEVTRGGVIENRERSDEEKDPTLETELRRRKSAPWREFTETIPAEDLLDFAHRTLITGAAGTGKSTLLRWLACAAAKRREGDVEARIPVWLSRLPPHHDLERDIAGTLARRALANLKLEEGPSEAFCAIREAILSGQTLLLIDSLDEAPVTEREHAEEWLVKLEGRVVLASRPMIEGVPLKDVKPVTLHGIPGIAAEQLLRKYFAGEDWVDGLLQELHSLPDGQTWLETPVLLGLAATLYRSDRTLPHATIELYRRAVAHLLASERLPPKYRGDVLRAELRELARDRLLPREGAPRIIFDLNDVPHARQETYKQTGLFEGESRFRFTHLTLGEFLAAEAEIDLAAERAKLLIVQGPIPEGSALEVVPMAHALVGTTALQETLAEARDRDLSDHRLLRLLLRAIGYGGPGVAAFCSSHVGEVVRLVVQRLDAPSGRFGDSEMALMDAAERAFLAMRALVDMAEVEHVFARLLRLPGNVGTEAHVATWILGVRKPERRESNWWPTVERQARALVRAGAGIDEVLTLTQGADGQNQWRAACYLAQYPEVRPRLRPLLYHDQDMGRRYMSLNLAHDADSEADWRERLGDEDRTTREFCVKELAENLNQRAIYLPRLLDMLARDPSDEVRATLIDTLAEDPAARPMIRQILFTTTSADPIRSGATLSLHEAAICALACDPESEETVRAYVSRAKECWSFTIDDTLRKLASIPRWRQLLLKRLDSSDVDRHEIRACAQDPDAEEPLKRLLDSGADVACVAAEVLGARADRSRLIQFLNHDNVQLRCAAISALGKHSSTGLLLREFLTRSPPERIAAAKALMYDVDALGSIQDNLLRYPAQEVRKTAIEVLSEHSIALPALREYFEETRSSPTDEIGTISHGYLRKDILKALTRSSRYKDLVISALEDPDPHVQAEAVRALASDPTMTARLSQKFYSDPDVFVYEAICDTMSSNAPVKGHLLFCLSADLDGLRSSTFRYLVDRAGERDRLRAMLSLPTASEDWRATIIGPLTRDPDSIELVRACVHDASGHVRSQALRVLRHDRLVRHDLRERARDVEWLKGAYRLTRGLVLAVLKSDPEAHPILASHLTIEDSLFLSLIVPTLREYPRVHPELLALLDHPFVEVQAAAMRALGGYEPIRARLIAALEPDAPIEHGPDTDMMAVIHSARASRMRRSAAADALKDIPNLRVEFRALLANEDNGVREAAIHAVSADRSLEARRLLRERLSVEEEENLRFQIIEGLRADPEAVGALRDRLHNDYKRAVRKAAAEALGLGDLSPAYPLRELPSVARVLGAFDNATAPRPGTLSTFLSAPRHLDMATEPELGEDVLAWACARLTWAYEIGRVGDGQILGEVESYVASVFRPGSLFLIRVAMDTFVLPRERFLRPNHNLMEVWEVARHLVASDPPTVMLACADVAFAHIQPPSLEPGEVRFGPTFFGFRISRDHRH
jgi:glycosyltransferase involved in cell wall biosynthesis/HEAT repeat protein